MRRAIVTLTLATALIGSTILSVASPVNAANEEGVENITLTPAVSRPSLDAGQSLDGKMTVINNGESDYRFVVYARPYSVKGEQYDPDFTEVDEKTRAYQWVAFNQTEYRLAAGEKVDVPYIITVPANAAGGGHYAVLFAETQPDGSDETGVMRKKRVGSLVYMTVKGEVIQSGSLESWDVRTWQTKLPISSNVRLKNTGNTHFQADLQVQYSDIFGRERFKYDKQLLILPGTTRRIPIEWSEAPAFGIFKASGSVDYLDKSDALEARYIILLPVNILLAILAVMLLIIVVAVAKRRRSRPMRLR